jgi:hypothetical protein
MTLSAMITIFYVVVLSVIHGVALNTVLLPLSKGRTLHQRGDTAAALCSVGGRRVLGDVLGGDTH